MRVARTVLLVLAVWLVGACGGEAPGPPSPAPSSPGATTAAQTAGCRASQLGLDLIAVHGAAGTRVAGFRLTNRSSAGCALGYYVGIQLLDAQGRPLPTHVQQGGGPVATEPGPTRFTLSPAEGSVFDLAWSAVPHGAETSCPAAARLQITPPGETTALELPVGSVDFAPCNAGEVFVYPLKPPGVGPA